MSDFKKLVTISPEIFDKLPKFMLISGMAEMNPDKAPDVEKIKSYLESSWALLQSKINDPISEELRRIQQWNEALKEAGIKIKDFPPSIQSIAKRAVKGGAPFSINPIVDTYNALSMELALPLGAYDCDGLQLRVSPGDESFIALGSTENDPTINGEIVFSDSENILTRMFLWRQSDKSKISVGTQQFIFVCELLDSMDPDLLERAKGLIVEKMESLLGLRISGLSVQSRSNF